MSFQNLAAAKLLVSEMFGINLSADLTVDEWQSAVRGFQKRHLYAHRMGVVDDDYIKKTGEAQAVIGRKVLLRADEVGALVQIIRRAARNLSSRLRETMVRKPDNEPS